MIKLDRSGFAAPAGWAGHVAGAIPDAAGFRRAALAFERKPINDTGRRNGFVAHITSEGLAVLPLNSRGKYEFKGIRGVAKPELLRMSRGKCAYCEASVADSQDGDVEHFRPKSLFPTHAYDLDNYLPGCRLCNRKKLNQWPDSGQYVQPDVDPDPSSRLEFLTDGKVKAVPTDRDAAVTIEHFGLNRKPLIERRKTQIDFVLRVVTTCVRVHGTNAAAGKQEAQANLTELRKPGGVYSAALTQAFLRAWNAAVPGDPLV